MNRKFWGLGAALALLAGGGIAVAQQRGFASIHVVDLTAAPDTVKPARQKEPTPECPERPLPKYATRMAGGVEASAGYWPGYVAVGTAKGANSYYFCGGVLVDERTVVTAAHCLNFSDQAGNARAMNTGTFRGDQLVVLANQDDIRSDATATRRKVVSAQIFEQGAEKYNQDSNKNDLAVLKLDADLPPPYAKIAGSEDSNSWMDGHLLWAGGFGQIDKTPRTTPFATRAGGKAYAQVDLLQEVVLPVIPTNDCRDDLDDKKQICTGYSREKRDTCAGDSGGPLVAIGKDNCPYVVGLTSFGASTGPGGYECGGGETYGVYTRLSAYRSWIEKNSKAKFATGAPQPQGAQAISHLLAVIASRYAAPRADVTLEILDITGKPLPKSGARYIVPNKQPIRIRVKTGTTPSARLLVMDVRGSRTVMNGELSAENQVLYPLDLLGADDPRTDVKDATGKVRAGDEILIPASGSVTADKNDGGPNGRITAVILPEGVPIEKILASVERTRGANNKGAGAQAVRELQAANALLGQAPADAAGARFPMASVDYEIR